MRFPYKVKIGDTNIPAGVDIPEENNVGAAENAAPVVSQETETVEREAVVSEEPKRRGRRK